jgi:pre-mRNA 3'-end-processing factor FIP1
MNQYGVRFSRSNHVLTDSRTSKSSSTSRRQHQLPNLPCTLLFVSHSTIIVLANTSSSQPQESKAIKIEAPPQTSTSVTPSTQPKTQATQPAQQLLNQDGRNYPAQRTSTIDVNADPVYPPLNKPISQIDFDSDFAESQMPWRVPGADPSDYFNYGFDEFTWVLYQGKQQSMTQAREQVTNEVQELQQMFGGGPSGPGAPATTGAGGGGPGVPGAPTGPAAATGGAVQPPMGPAANMPPAMPGMPPMTEENMQMMMAQMQANGMDMTNMDFNSFMQMASGMFPGGAGGPGGAQAGFGQGQGGHGQGGAVRGGRRGRGW